MRKLSTSICLTAFLVVCASVTMLNVFHTPASYADEPETSSSSSESSEGSSNSEGSNESSSSESSSCVSSESSSLSANSSSDSSEALTGSQALLLADESGCQVNIEECNVECQAAQQQNPLATLWAAGPAQYVPQDALNAQTATFEVQAGANGYNYMKIRNRGMMVSRNGYVNGVNVSFRWKWVAGTPNGNYPDILSVAFHTNGAQRNMRSWEIMNGIVVRLTNIENGTAQAQGQVKVERFENGASVQVLGSRFTDVFEPNTLYPIHIQQVNGQNGAEGSIQVDWGSGANQTLSANNVPVRPAAVANNAANNKVAIYNREIVAGVRQESHVAAPTNGSMLTAQ